MYINENPTKENLQEINDNLKNNRYSIEWNEKTSVSLADIIANGTYFDMAKFRQSILKTLGAKQEDITETYLNLCQKNGNLPEAKNLYLNVSDVVIAMRDIAEHYKGQELPENINSIFNEDTAYCVSKKLLRYSYFNSMSQDNQQTKDAFDNFVVTLEKAYGPFIGKDNLPAHKAYLNEVIARHQQREVDVEFVLPE